VWSFNRKITSANGGYINALVISSANKSVYTGWFKVEPSTEYIFSSSQSSSEAGTKAKVYIEFAYAADYATDSFTPTTKTLIASNSTFSQIITEFNLKTGGTDRRARFVLENSGSTAYCVFGELKCLETQKSYIYKNNIFPNNTFANKSLSGWKYSGVDGVVPKSSLSSVNYQFNEVPNWVTLGAGESLVSHCPVSDLYAKGVYGLNGQQFSLNFYRGVDNGAAGGTLKVFLNHLTLSGTFSKTQLSVIGVDAGSSVSSVNVNFVLPSTGMFNISFEANGTSKNLFIGAPYLRMLVTSDEIAADRPYESSAANIKMDGAQSVGSLNTVARGDHVHPTDTTRAAVASFANVKTASGYQRFEGGMIMQWGTFIIGAAAAANASVSFPIAFPSSCLHGIVNVDNAALDQIGVVNKTLTSMVVQKGTSDNGVRTGTWIAIGY
jgi:hypothetical protein